MTVGIELLNIERYPIDALDSDRGQAFLVDCRQRMAVESSLILPDIVRTEVVSTIINDLEAAETISDEKLRTPYSWRYNLDFSSGHPRRALFRSSINSILADSFPADGMAARLFDCDELTEFVRRLLEVETLFPSACPTLSLMASVLHEGDENGWHFDTNDGRPHLQATADPASLLRSATWHDLHRRRTKLGPLPDPRPLPRRTRTGMTPLRRAGFRQDLAGGSIQIVDAR